MSIEDCPPLAPCVPIPEGFTRAQITALAARYKDFCAASGTPVNQWIDMMWDFSFGQREFFQPDENPTMDELVRDVMGEHDYIPHLRVLERHVKEFYLGKIRGSAFTDLAHLVRCLHRAEKVAYEINLSLEKFDCDLKALHVATVKSGFRWLCGLVPVPRDDLGGVLEHIARMDVAHPHVSIDAEDSDDDDDDPSSSRGGEPGATKSWEEYVKDFAHAIYCGERDFRILHALAPANLDSFIKRVVG